MVGGRRSSRKGSRKGSRKNSRMVCRKGRNASRRNRRYHGGAMILESEYATIDSPTMLLEGGPTAGGSGDFSDPWMKGQ
jgi:hypothetical protein